jgi:hypothetical protein
MCGTVNDQSAQSCTFCGYLFEDYGTGTVSPPKAASPVENDNKLNAMPLSTDQNSVPKNTYAPSAMSTGAPLYLVSKSLLSSVVPALVYLIFIGFVGLSSGFSLYTIGLIAFFMVIALVPALLSPSRFEFYEDSLKVHKTIGGDSEVMYSNLTLVDYPTRGRSPQIVLSAEGQRRPIVIGKNPTNQNLGMDLKQFLTTKVKKMSTPGSSGSATPPATQESSTENAEDHSPI